MDDELPQLDHVSRVPERRSSGNRNQNSKPSASRGWFENAAKPLSEGAAT
jgi:hypothetical protein